MERTYTDENHIVDSTGVYTARSEARSFPLPKLVKDERISPIPIRIIGRVEIGGSHGLGIVWIPRKGFECRSVIPLAHFDIDTGDTNAIAQWVDNNLAARGLGLKLDAIARYIKLSFELVKARKYDLTDADFMPTLQTS